MTDCENRPQTAVTTYFNSRCPVCAPEIRRYRRKADAAELEELAWCDINGSPDALAGFGVTLEDVRRKLHAVDAQGRVHVGVDAFAAIWEHLPGYRWAAKLLRLPGLSTAARLLYDGFAALLYAWNRRQQRRQQSSRA